MDTITYELEVRCPVREAFEIFTDAFGRWWPPEYSWSQEGLVYIGMEPRVGGRCTEIGPEGFQLDPCPL